MTSSCFVKRVVPFVITLACGVAVWQAFGDRGRAPHVGPHVSYGTWATDAGVRERVRDYARPAGGGSRTWLVIRSTPSVARKANSECDGCSVRMRVLFNEHGVAVPGNQFSLSPTSYPLIEEAVAAARAIEFTPATKNGRPVPVWANVTYACGEEYVPHATGPGAVTCGLSVDDTSAGTWEGRSWRATSTNE